MDYKYTKYDSKYLNSLVDLIDASFQIENKDKLALIKWKLFNAYHSGNTITYIAIDTSKKVIGQYTNLPYKIEGFNQIFNSLACIDMTVLKDYRGQGIISQLSKNLYQEVTRKKFDFTVGFSNDEGILVDKNSKGYGYKLVGSFVRYFKIIIYPKKINLHLKLTTSFNKNFTPDKNVNYFRVYKDSGFLNWRYKNKPNNDYSIYEIINNEKFSGYVILRFLANKCYVYDILQTNISKEDFSIVLRGIENEALKKGVRIVVYNVMDNNFWRNLFNKFKYFKKIKNNVNYYLTVKIHNESTNPDKILDKNNWILMNGDIL